MFTVTRRTRQDLRWDEVLEAVARHTQTAVGRERAYQLPFLECQEDIDLSFRQTQEIRDVTKHRGGLPLSGIVDARAALQRAQKQAVLTAEELRTCAAMIEGVSALYRLGRSHAINFEALAPLLMALPEHDDIAKTICAMVTPSGFIQDSASRLLKQQRLRVQELQQSITKHLDVFLNAPEYAPVLQDRYVSVRGDRYVLPIGAQFRNRFAGIVHDTSNSGQTVFIEPQALIELGNELTIAQAAIRIEEQRILALLSDDVRDVAESMLACLAYVAQIDCLAAFAKLADVMQAEVPHLQLPEDKLALQSVRHPLLVLDGIDVQPNDIVFAPEINGVILSGPNAGGKTVALTAVGLCALMVRAGMLIPAARTSRMPLFAGVHCAMGDGQDVHAGLSSFSAHVASLKQIVDDAQQGWLVLIDEIGKDTDPQEGAALAQAVLEYLVARGAVLFVTTHLEPLKALAVVQTQFENASVGFDRKTHRASYRMRMGSAGVSDALVIAEQMGMQPQLIAQARKHLHGKDLLTQAWAQLRRLEQDAEQVREKTYQGYDSMRQAQQAFVQQKQQWQQKTQLTFAEMQQNLAQEIRQIREEILQEMSAWRAQPNRRDADRLERKWAKQSIQAQQEGQRLAAQAQARVTVAEHRPPTVGDRVRVLSLNQHGTLIERDGQRCVVQIGSLRTRVKFRDLVLDATQKAIAPRFVISEHRVTQTDGLDLDASRLDVRGLRLDEAERALERAIDRGLSQGIRALWVTHGLGTGGLRRGLWDFLRTAAYIESFASAEPHEGGEAVTIVRLLP